MKHQALRDFEVSDLSPQSGSGKLNISYGTRPILHKREKKVIIPLRSSAHSISLQISVQVRSLRIARPKHQPERLQVY